MATEPAAAAEATATDTSASLDMDAILEQAVVDIKAAKAAPADAAAEPVDTAVAKPAEPAAETVEDPETAKRLGAIARSERRAREGLAAREGEIIAREAKLQEQLARVSAIEAAQARAKADPIGFLRSMGVDVDAEEAWAEKLGQQAPPELRQKIAMRQMERKVAQLEADRAAEVKQYQAQQAQQQQAQLWERARVEVEHDILPALPDTLTHVKASAKHNPARTAATLLDMARAAKNADPHGPPPDIKALAEKLEKALVDEIAPYKAIYSTTATPAAAAAVTPAATKQTPPVAEKQSPAAPKTLSNQQATRTPPRASPQTMDELMEETLAEIRAGAHLT